MDGHCCPPQDWLGVDPNLHAYADAHGYQHTYADAHSHASIHLHGHGGSPHVYPDAHQDAHAAPD